MGRGASTDWDWAERVAWLELSWAFAKDAMSASKRTKTSKNVFGILLRLYVLQESDSMRGGSLCSRTKNRCVLANTAAGKKAVVGVELELQLHSKLNHSRRTQIEYAGTRYSAEPVVIGLGGIID